MSTPTTIRRVVSTGTDRLTINDLVDIAHRNSREKGFHDGPQNIPEKLMLIVSEISEALEEVRAGHHVNEVRVENGKPEGFPIEIADAVIRIADLCGMAGIDLEAAIALKHSYNVNRPHMHGKKF